MKVRILLTLSILTLPILSSCASVIFAGVAASGVTLAQERTVGSAVDDNVIWSRIKAEMLRQDDSELFINIGVRVIERKVMLTGSVTTPEARAKAVQIAWSQNAVAEVLNEIQLKNSDGTYYKLYNYGMDGIITAQIKARFLASNEVRSINYTVDTVNQIVYLMGVAQNKFELEKVNQIAGTVKNVKKVVNHVRVKDTAFPPSHENRDY